MTITLRLGKGSPLTFTELDGNFNDLLARYLALDSNVSALQSQLNGLAAVSVDYANTFSGLLANSVQGAIDEVDTYSKGVNIALGIHTGAVDPHSQYTTQAEASAAAPVQSVAGKTGAVTLVKADAGLGNVDNTSDANKPVSTATQTALNLKENTANKGAVNGYASLDGAGKVPAAQLPSYVDDVLEVANFAALPVTGETSKIYITLDLGKSYRWTGSAYVELIASPGTTDAIVEGSTNLFFTQARTRTSVLTGLSTADSTYVVATDTLLVALGKLQAQADSLKDIVGNVQSTAYTVALTDRGLSIDTSANVTIPANGVVAFPVRSTIVITNTSAVAISVLINTDTLRLAGTAAVGTRTLAAYGVATIRKISATVWIISGMGLT